MSSVKQRGVINAFDAGPEQFLPCADTVTLTATVDGELGDFIFNAADNGKTVTGVYTYTKK